jgi:hypothetical protein
LFKRELSLLHEKEVNVSNSPEKKSSSNYDKLLRLRRDGGGTGRLLEAYKNGEEKRETRVEGEKPGESRLWQTYSRASQQVCDWVGRVCDRALQESSRVWQMLPSRERMSHVAKMTAILALLTSPARALGQAYGSDSSALAMSWRDSNNLTDKICLPPTPPAELLRKLGVPDAEEFCSAVSQQDKSRGIESLKSSKEEIDALKKSLAEFLKRNQEDLQDLREELRSKQVILGEKTSQFETGAASAQPEQDKSRGTESLKLSKEEIDALKSLAEFFKGNQGVLQDLREELRSKKVTPGEKTSQFETGAASAQPEQDKSRGTESLKSSKEEIDALKSLAEFLKRNQEDLQDVREELRSKKVTPGEKTSQFETGAASAQPEQDKSRGIESLKSSKEEIDALKSLAEFLKRNQEIQQDLQEALNDDKAAKGIKSLLRDSEVIEVIKHVLRDPEAMRGLKHVLKDPEAIGGLKHFLRDSWAVVGLENVLRDPRAVVGLENVLRDPEAIGGLKHFLKDPEAVKGFKRFLRDKGALINFNIIMKNKSFAEYTVAGAALGVAALLWVGVKVLKEEIWPKQNLEGQQQNLEGQQQNLGGQQQNLEGQRQNLKGQLGEENVNPFGGSGKSAS